MPLSCSETYYYLPLEEAPFQTFCRKFKFRNYRKTHFKNEIAQIPENSTVIVGFQKTILRLIKPYKISQGKQRYFSRIKQKQNVILDVFGSPYALKDVDISKISTVLVSYENNDLS